jgi:hypothetical protein
MRRETLKRISTLPWFALIGFLPGVLCADALQGGSPTQTRAIEQADDLSWPMNKLLVPSLNWLKYKRVAEKCLLVGRYDLKDPMDMHFLYAVDLPGERFVPTILSAGRALSWNFDEILEKAGYYHQVPVPDKRVFLSCQVVAMPHIASAQGYIKRNGKNIRLILVSHYDSSGGAETASGSAEVQYIPDMMAVFVSNITPIEQVLTKPAR